jgi:hypothetical protein
MHAAGWGRVQEECKSLPWRARRACLTAAATLSCVVADDPDAVTRLALPRRLTAYVQVPGGTDAPFRPEALVKDDPARWNAEGEPTAYLASDVAVAVSEFVRHLQPGPTGAPEPGPERRDVYRVEVDAPGIIDLRDPDVATALGIDEVPHCFLDERLARRVGSRVRGADGVAGMLTQPMAFLDRPDRWNLVLFADRLDGTSWCRDARLVQRLRLQRARG